MSQFYNLVLYTASYREYAEKIINQIDPKSAYIKNVLTREHCTKYKNCYIKDFRIVLSSQMKKEDIVILDNRVVSFSYDLFQGIPILPFYDDESDTELRDIVPFLIHLSSRKVIIKEELKLRYNYERIRQLTFNDPPSHL